MKAISKQKIHENNEHLFFVKVLGFSFFLFGSYLIAKLPTLVFIEGQLFKVDALKFKVSRLICMKIVVSSCEITINVLIL